MQGRGDPAQRTPSAAVAAASVDHIRLSYQYLDGGDIDGFASLLDPRAVVRRPGAAPARGRPEVERTEWERFRRSRGHHMVDRVFAADGRAAAVGRFVPAAPGEEYEFADIYTITDAGLLVARDTYFFAHPS